MGLDEELERLITKIESYEFECEGGPLTLCVDWTNLRDAIAALRGQRQGPIATFDLGSLKCRFGCTDDVEGIYWMPKGCVCYPDQVQALCKAHEVSCEPLEYMERIDSPVSPAPAGWQPIETYKLGSGDDLRIKLRDGSELNVLPQADGDFWWAPKDAFIDPDQVTHWQPIVPPLTAAEAGQ